MTFTLQYKELFEFIVTNLLFYDTVGKSIMHHWEAAQICGHLSYDMYQKNNYFGAVFLI